MIWIYLVQNRDHWLAVVNKVMGIPLSAKCWNILEWLSD
jgi:hypothetical protein